MKIAVLIPCYNVETFLAECLESVLAAATAGMRILCCDDGSVDGTWNILETYAAKHPNISIYKHGNHGVSYTRNFLLDQLDDAVDAFAFVDADDLVATEYFSRLAEAMERTHCDVAEYAADLVKVETLVEDTTVLWLKRTNPGVRSAIIGKLISRPVAGGIRLRPELKYEEDLMYSYEVNAVIRRKVVLPGLPYDYRYNPNSATQKLNWRKYVESACRRIELFKTEFLDAGRVPVGLEGEFEREMAADAYRMCFRKNFRKNGEAESRRELFVCAKRYFEQHGLGKYLPAHCRHGYLPAYLMSWVI